MLSFGQLSYWERTQYIEQNTFVIVGAGLVGMSTALSLKERFPLEKVLISERGLGQCFDCKNRNTLERVAIAGDSPVREMTCVVLS